MGTFDLMCALVDDVDEEMGKPNRKRISVRSSWSTSSCKRERARKATE